MFKKNSIAAIHDQHRRHGALIFYRNRNHDLDRTRIGEQAND